MTTTEHRTTEPSTTSTTAADRRRRPGFRALPLAIALAILGSLLLAAPADARTYAQGGSIGRRAIGTAGCSYSPRFGTLRIGTQPPSIWARDAHRGAGNDSARVRYRAFLVDLGTGRTVASTGYSGIAIAKDNAPARFSGTTWLEGNWRSNYAVDYRIEWLDSANRVVGWSAERFTSYSYFTNGVGPYGPFSSCYKAR